MTDIRPTIRPNPDLAYNLQMAQVRALIAEVARYNQECAADLRAAVNDLDEIVGARLVFAEDNAVVAHIVGDDYRLAPGSYDLEDEIRHLLPSDSAN